MNEPIQVRKLDHDGAEKLSYDGVVLARDAAHVTLLAPWTRGRYPLGYVTFEPGDVFVEHFYAERWYNIFEIHAADWTLKGWYCNVTRPAELAAREIRAEDLALDAWVWPGGRTLVLDEDEFAALPLRDEERRAARAALDELVRLAGAAALPVTPAQPPLSATAAD